jgi:amino acid transporter
MPPAATHELQRSLTWRDAFWVTSGVPAGVLFTIGGVSATVGNPAWLIWIVAIVIGFAQSFVYAEISGLYPHKSGGASVYGALAWVRYSKLVAPVSVWCNWIAWSPVLALGTSLAAGYTLTTLFPANSIVHTWQLTLLDLGFVRKGLTLRLNSNFILAAALLLLSFRLQRSASWASRRSCPCSSLRWCPCSPATCRLPTSCRCGPSRTTPPAHRAWDIGMPRG